MSEFLDFELTTTSSSTNGLPNALFARPANFVVLRRLNEEGHADPVTGSQLKGTILVITLNMDALRLSSARQACTSADKSYTHVFHVTLPAKCSSNVSSMNQGAPTASTDDFDLEVPVISQPLFFTFATLTPLRPD